MELNTLYCILLEKDFILNGPPLKWIESYFSCRKQFVYVNGADSELRDIKFEVPQGIILGPLLFKKFKNKEIFISHRFQI